MFDFAVVLFFHFFVVVVFWLLDENSFKMYLSIHHKETNSVISACVSPHEK
jgi:hypothetical protein